MLWQKTKANPSFRPHHSLLEINQPYYLEKCEEIGSEKPTQRACKLNHSFSPFIPNNLCIKVGPKDPLDAFLSLSLPSSSLLCINNYQWASYFMIFDPTPSYLPLYPERNAYPVIHSSRLVQSLVATHKPPAQSLNFRRRPLKTSPSPYLTAYLFLSIQL